MLYAYRTHTRSLKLLATNQCDTGIITDLHMHARVTVYVDIYVQPCCKVANQTWCTKPLGYIYQLYVYSYLAIASYAYV